MESCRLRNLALRPSQAQMGTRGGRPESPWREGREILCVAVLSPRAANAVVTPNGQSLENVRMGAVSAIAAADGKAEGKKPKDINQVKVRASKASRYALPANHHGKRPF